MNIIYDILIFFAGWMTAMFTVAIFHKPNDSFGDDELQERHLRKTWLTGDEHDSHPLGRQ